MYRYSVTWSPEDEVYVSRVVEFPLLAAHGDTQDEALAAIRSVVATVVEELETSEGDQ
jgi:predicted RNase H-like HicB family nuclease